MTNELKKLLEQSSTFIYYSEYATCTSCTSRLTAIDCTLEEFLHDVNAYRF